MSLFQGFPILFGISMCQTPGQRQSDQKGGDFVGGCFHNG